MPFGTLSKVELPGTIYRIFEIWPYLQSQSTEILHYINILYMSYVCNTGLALARGAAEKAILILVSLSGLELLGQPTRRQCRVCHAWILVSERPASSNACT